MSLLSLKASTLGIAMLGMGCASIQVSAANSKEDRPEIYMMENRGTWVGLGRPLGPKTKVILSGPGFTSDETKVKLLGKDGVATDCAAPGESATHRVCSAPEGKRVVSIIITPVAEEFDGTEAMCLLGPSTRGCVKPNNASLYRPVRVARTRSRDAETVDAEPKCKEEGQS